MELLDRITEILDEAEARGRKTVHIVDIRKALEPEHAQRQRVERWIEQQTDLWRATRNREAAA